MIQSLFTITENVCLAKNIWRMRLQGDTSAITAPGQFVNIKLEGFFLRRPISVNDVEGDILTLIYKPLGEGTRQMTTFQPGKVLDILTGLGNGFDPALSGEKPVLVGGGVGIPPLFNLCKKLIAKGAKPVVVVFRGASAGVSPVGSSTLAHMAAPMSTKQAMMAGSHRR